MIQMSKFSFDNMLAKATIYWRKAMFQRLSLEDSSPDKSNF